jgi:hypothetical protein
MVLKYPNVPRPIRVEVSSVGSIKLEIYVLRPKTEDMS